MEPTEYLRFLGALVFVLGLLGGAAWLARRAGLLQTATGTKKNARLGISETLRLDARRKLVLIRRDDREHLLLLGETDLHIEKDITGKDIRGMEDTTRPILRKTAGDISFSGKTSRTGSGS